MWDGLFVEWHSSWLSSQNPGCGEQGSKVNILTLLKQIAKNTDPTCGSRSHGSQRVHHRCGRSPVCWTTEHNALSISYKVPISIIYCAILITLKSETGPQRTLFLAEWKTSLWQSSFSFSTFHICCCMGEHWPRRKSLWSYPCRLHDLLGRWSKVTVERFCWLSPRWLSHQEDWMQRYARNAEIDWEGIHYQGQGFKMPI